MEEIINNERQIIKDWFYNNFPEINKIKYLAYRKNKNGNRWILSTNYTFHFVPSLKQRLDTLQLPALTHPLLIR